MNELHKHTRPTPIPEAPVIPPRLRMMTERELALTALAGLEETREHYQRSQVEARERATRREAEQVSRDKVLAALATGFSELSKESTVQSAAILQLVAQGADRLKTEKSVLSRLKALELRTGLVTAVTGLLGTSPTWAGPAWDAISKLF